MKSKFINGVCFISGIIITFIGFKIFEVKQSLDPIIITKDRIIRDSIFIINDSIITEIKYIEKDYNEKVNTIMSSNDSSNLEFFSRYLKDFEQTIKID